MTWGGSLRADRPGAGQRPVFHGIGTVGGVRLLILTVAQAVPGCRGDSGLGELPGYHLCSVSGISTGGSEIAFPWLGWLPGCRSGWCSW